MHEDLIHELVLAARQMERFLDEYEFIVDVTQEEALLKVWGRSCRSEFHPRDTRIS